MLPADPAVDAYVEQTPEARREGLRLLRRLCREHLEGRRADQIDPDVVRSILDMTAATRGPIC